MKDASAPKQVPARPARSIVVANAGSGKTWTLANRILAWCMEEVREGRAPEPSRILAVTFTRKAAGEILARILTHAATASCDSPEGEQARESFAPVVGDATHGQYQTVLAALARDLHRMQVGTIDGFFHRIASALPDEVGLAGDWTIGEERELDALRAQAAARVLSTDGAADLVALLEEGAPRPSVLSSLTGLLGGTSISVLEHYRASLAPAPASHGLPQHPSQPPPPGAAQPHSAARIDRAWRWLARIPSGADLAGARGAELRDQLFGRLVALKIPTKKPTGRSKGGEEEPLVHWANAHARIAQCAQRGDLRGIAADTAIATMRATGSFSRRALPDDWAEALQLLEPHVRHLLIGDLQGRIEGALKVLPVADVALRELQEDTGLYAFGDLGLGVARAASTDGTRASTAAGLERALGCTIADLAIDEAQDTSAEQFAAMRPLIERVLGVGDGGARRGRFLLVGDPKQSIYGWRGGTPGLIAEIARRYGAHLDSDAPLTRSYRSSPILMDFVNRVFADLAGDLDALVEDQTHLHPLTRVTELATREQLPDCVLHSAFRRAADEWRFERHEAEDRRRSGWIKAYACGTLRKPSKKQTKGDSGDEPGDAVPSAGAGGESMAGPAVPLAVSASDLAGGAARAGASAGAGAASDSAPEPVSASVRAAAIAAALHRAHPERTIAVLVRTNRAVNETIDALRALGVAASDEGKATLLDSPAVAGLVALLRLIDEPGDRIAHFLVSRGPLQAASGLAPLESAPSLDAAHGDAVRFALRMRAEIADRGLASVLRAVVRDIVQDIVRASQPGGPGEAAGAPARADAVALSPRDRARLERVVALAEEFEAAPVARLGAFIEALESDKADASSADRVRVMTVHKSKGLEFDEVVLHAMNDPWGDAPSGWGILAVDPTKPPALVAPLANEMVRQWVPELSVLERDERRRRLLDDLSAFYVAITRARRGLHLVIDLKQSDSYPTGARLVARALARPETSMPSHPDDTVAGAGDFAVRLAEACEASAEGRPPRAGDGPFWESRYDGGDGVVSIPIDQVVPVDRDLPLPATDKDAGGPSSHRNAPGAALHETPLVEIVARPPARVKPPSSHDAPSLWAFDPFGDDDIALRGVLVHECFREVESIETLAAAVAPDAPPDGSIAALVDRAARRTAIEKATPVPPEMRGEVAGMLFRLARATDAAASIGQRLRIGPLDRVRNEFPFLRESPGGGVVSGRIDRLVLHGDAAGRVVGATIVDYKTGAKHKSPEALERTLVGYRAQMRAYCEAVEELWSLPSGTARAVLLFVDRDEVIEVPASSDGPGP